MNPWIVGNWKMHGLNAQLGVVESVAAEVKARQPLVDVVLCVPATLVYRASRTAAGRIEIGGEDCSRDIDGAYTGDISAEMLKDAGAGVVIVGHSERRQYHGESDGMVADKAKAAWRGGLKSIICIGETALQRERGTEFSVCAAQIAASVPDDMPSTGNAVGYEPLWAIGTGHVPTLQQITGMHAHIRRCLIARCGDPGKAVRILYGGSVKPSNAREILALPDVDGALVGGASLRAADFNDIIRAAAH